MSENWKSQVTELVIIPVHLVRYSLLVHLKGEMTGHAKELLVTVFIDLVLNSPTFPDILHLHPLWPARKEVT